MIDQHLSFNNHIEHEVNKVLRKLGVFRRLRISLTMAAAEYQFLTIVMLHGRGVEK